MSNFFFKPKTNKHLCCPPPIEKANINSPLLIYKFPCKIKLAMKIRSAVGSSNHNQCYTVANQTLNAYGKWAGCPGGSGPGYSSTMRFVPYDNGSGLGPSIGGAICNCVYQAPQPPYLPVNIEAPIISGNTLYGSTLTLTGEGIWLGNPPPTLTFQWLRNGVVIGGATSITYVTQLADVGQQITCRVRGTNSVGSVSAISNVITVTSLPSNTIAPVISGNPVVGSTLTTTNGTWTGFPAPTFTYQWLRNGVVIGGATSITYVTQVADVGQQITCRVTGTNSVGSVSAISNVITVTSLPSNTIAPVISGNPVVGSTLTTTNGTWTGFPTPTFTYQWLRNGLVIGGATSITYITQVADVGQQITCRVTGTNIVGSVNAISNVITPTGAPVNTTLPSISGSPLVGSTLTTTNGTWIGFPSPTFTYQWLRNGLVIVGATIITYVTRVADVGQQITCRVRGTNIIGFSEAVSNIIIPQNVTTPSQTVTFTGTVNFETIYVNSLNQVDTGPVLNGFTIYRVTSTSLGTTYLINSNLPSTPISFLIVGGGGSGGAGGAVEGIINGAGGAGGLIDSSGTTNSNTTYSIYVGTGGVASTTGANGEDSLLQLTSGTLTAIGGGRGGNITNLNGLSGGSGGGGAYNANGDINGLGGNGTIGPPRQGFSGADGLVNNVVFSGSGGGAGGAASVNGGVGLSSTITGQSTFYAGGGGGLNRSGGTGGGGNSGTSGTNGLGGGGGGGASSGTSGGSGIVILRISSFV